MEKEIIVKKLIDLAYSKGYDYTLQPLLIFDIVTWLRDTHDIHAFVTPRTGPDGKRLYESWLMFEWCTDEETAKNDDQPYFEDYFEALEDAVRDAFEVLERKP